jgi:hypothetical protein
MFITDRVKELRLNRLITGYRESSMTCKLLSFLSPITAAVRGGVSCTAGGNSFPVSRVISAVHSLFINVLQIGTDIALSNNRDNAAAGKTGVLFSQSSHWGAGL